MRNIPTILLGVSMLAACQLNPQVEKRSAFAAPAAEFTAGSAKAGFDLSEALCSGCHAIALGEVSPNPEAPPFEAIANSSGLTVDTLSKWMLDSYNFPEKMSIEVADEDVEHIAAYMITLRRDDYTPPTQ